MASRKLSSFLFVIVIILVNFLHLCPCILTVSEINIGFRYDIFTRAAFVILKDGGSPATAKKCKFCASIQLNHRPIVGFQGLQGLQSINLVNPLVTFSYCALVRQLRTCCETCFVTSIVSLSPSYEG